MPAFPERYAAIVARLRVPGGFVMVAAFAWLSAPTPRSLAVGLPVSLLGLVLRSWAAGCLAKNQQLATTGPFAYTRNPLYLGTLLVAAGLVVASRSAYLGVLCAAFFLLVYLPVIQREEQHLRRLFPEYNDYAGAVPAFWPRFQQGFQLHPARDPHGFRWPLYVKNQEYQAAAGFAAGVLFLLWKVVR
jgi:protein-S-isoprenylcysteine O-methyltransferase Ste14